MSVTVIGAHERVRRLVKLYALRGQIDEEIHTIEAEMANEAEYVKQARAESNTKARIAPCGTDSGYYRHLRREKRPACPACLAAHSKATRKRVAKKAESPVVDSDSPSQACDNETSPTVSVSALRPGSDHLTLTKKGGATHER